MIDCAGHVRARRIVNGVDQKTVLAKNICQIFRIAWLEALWRHQQPESPPAVRELDSNRSDSSNITVKDRMSSKAVI
jgi:hypothetical protein